MAVSSRQLGRSGDTEQEGGELDQIDGGLLAAILPIGIEHTFDEFGIKQVGETM